MAIGQNVDDVKREMCCLCPHTCSQCWESSRLELLVLAKLQHRMNSVFNVGRVVLADDVDDGSAGQLPCRRQDHGTRLGTRSLDCREEC